MIYKLDIKKHISNIASLDLAEMIDSNAKHIRELEKIKMKNKTPDDRYYNGLRLKYIDDLKKLGFLLYSGSKPIGVDDDIFLSFKPLIEILVNKGQLNETALDIFLNI